MQQLLLWHQSKHKATNRHTGLAPRHIVALPRFTVAAGGISFVVSPPKWKVASAGSLSPRHGLVQTPSAALLRLRKLRRDAQFRKLTQSAAQHVQHSPLASPRRQRAKQATVAQLTGAQYHPLFRKVVRERAGVSLRKSCSSAANCSKRKAGAQLPPAQKYSTRANMSSPVSLCGGHHDMAGVCAASAVKRSESTNLFLATKLFS